MKSMEDIIKEIQKDFFISETKSKVVIENIRRELKDYIDRNNLKSLIIGVSGGLDSACVAAICQEKYTGIPLIGVSIPMSNTKDHIEKAKWVGDNFCSVFEEFDEWEGEIVQEINDNFLSEIFYDNIFRTLEMTDKIAEKAGFEVSKFPKNVLKGNMKARLRMMTLYDLARKTNGIVLSTDNYSEYLMGFWTICGDVGDYAPIQKIFKGLELSTIAKTLEVRTDIIEQKPSDGLMVTEDNTDEAQLGANYLTVDTIMCCFMMEKYYDYWIEIKNIPYVIDIVKRYVNTEFKRRGTIILERNQIGI